jgi:hypothetical protein
MTNVISGNACNSLLLQTSFIFTTSAPTFLFLVYYAVKYFSSFCPTVLIFYQSTFFPIEFHFVPAYTPFILLPPIFPSILLPHVLPFILFFVLYFQSTYSHLCYRSFYPAGPSIHFFPPIFPFILFPPILPFRYSCR